MRVVGFILCCFIIFGGLAYAGHHRPNKGDWVCWVNSINNKECGTYGWSKKKNVAFEVAKDKCEWHCDSECILDYCEKL